LLEFNNMAAVSGISLLRQSAADALVGGLRQSAAGVLTGGIPPRRSAAGVLTGGIQKSAADALVGGLRQSAAGVLTGGFKPRTPRAFSLVELVLVLAIVAVVSAIAIPRYGNSITKYRLDAAARRIITDFAQARSQAMTTSQSQTIVFTTATSTYQIAGVTGLDVKTAPYAVDLRLDPYQATLVSASFGGSSTATFDAYGAAAAGGTVVIQVGGTQKTITLDADSGRATAP
jgi:prepilin-type N-terminal cleavage/methylation domain-containing protein